MKTYRLKLTIAAIVLALFAIGFFQTEKVRANQGGPPPGLTGALGESDCASSGCHTGNEINSDLGTLTISGLPAAYRPDQEINLTVTLGQPNRARFGFQLTVVDGQGRKAGELFVTDAERTQKITTFVGNSQRDYIFHTGVGTAPSGTSQGSWTMRWKAPSQGVGRVTFHASGNAANGNGAQTGDFIYVSSESLQAAEALPEVASVSAASFAPGALAPESIAAAFGSGFSQSIRSAPTLPLPMTLDGTQVIIRDVFSVERPAPLFFVSPGQINYLVPQGLFPGAATVFVRRNNDEVAEGTITVETSAPALFAANSNGQGVAAAVVLRVRNSQQSYEPVSRAEGGNQVPVPIDLGAETDQVYLLLFGTGFRGLVPPATISVTVGGMSVPVPGFAAVEGFAGLDQCNVGPLPRSLAGRGNLNIVLTAGVKTANTLSLNIK